MNLDINEEYVQDINEEHWHGNRKIRDTHGQVKMNSK